MCDVLKQMKNIIFWDMVEGGHRFNVWTKGGHEQKKVGNPWVRLTTERVMQSSGLVKISKIRNPQFQKL